MRDSGSGAAFSVTDLLLPESHLGQEGELVLLKQRLAGVEEDGMGDALSQGRDATLACPPPCQPARWLCGTAC